MLAREERCDCVIKEEGQVIRSLFARQVQRQQPRQNNGGDELRNYLTEAGDIPDLSEGQHT
jgi:hypothetical protein